MRNNIFLPSDLLLFHGPDRTAFSVVACDQYTSEPEYWERVEQYVDGKPSSLRLIYPEAYLKAPDCTKRINAINQNMTEYLQKEMCIRDSHIFAKWNRIVFFGIANSKPAAQIEFGKRYSCLLYT